ncbi:MAG: hypothetical protein KDI79_29850 [Anaerolineae bacterium]|nr:hypothetical protein [Anaerolineae bacterium]
MDFAKFSDAMWQRHAHPLSVWSRLLSTPLAFVPLWNRSWKQRLVVGVDCQGKDEN